MSLKEQVSRILNAKIRRISHDCFRQANPRINPTQTRVRPYTLPLEVREMVAMLRRIEEATNEELEQFAHYATTGAVREASK